MDLKPQPASFAPARPVQACREPLNSRARSVFGVLSIFAILVLMLASFLPTTAFAAAMSNPDADTGGITAVQENGRTIYVNDVKPSAKAGTKSAQTVRRASVLVYWSNKEKRWKPVPAPSPTAMRAARDAAAEVSRYVGAMPRLAPPANSGTSTPPRALALENPNYRNLARGVAVTSAEVDAAIEQAAAHHQVDPNLVRAMVKVESNFNPRAVSHKGAMGLMQLMPATARQLNVSNPFDPQENVDAGVRYMKNLLHNFKGDLRLSLAAYNAGEGAVTRSRGVPRIGETQNYVKQITDLYWNGGPIADRSFGGSAPIRVFRGQDGKLTITNQ